MRARSDRCCSDFRLQQTSDDLLRVVQHDSKISVMHFRGRCYGSCSLYSIFVTLEYLNICEFSKDAGRLRGPSDLEDQGLVLLLVADTLNRKKVYRFIKRKELPTFSSALLEVPRTTNSCGTMFVQARRSTSSSGRSLTQPPLGGEGRSLLR